MAKRGRPAWVPSPLDIQKVKTAALAGMSIKKTARFLRIAPNTYIQGLKKFPELLNSQEDTESEIDIVASKGLVSLLVDQKNPGVRLSAIRLWLEKRGSDVWRRGNRVEHTGASGAPISIAPIEWVTPPKRNSEPRK